MRSGGDLVVASLEALGAETVFGLPGVHALPIWNALRTSSIELVGLRTELSTCFAAEGYAQATGRPAVAVVSSGPGALMSLAGVMEAATTHVPMLLIAPEVPRDLHGRHRGFLHELDDQLASFRPVVRQAFRASSAEALPGLLAQAWVAALGPPAGPVYVGVPYDVMRDATSVPPFTPRVAERGEPVLHPDAQSLDLAAGWLVEAERPVIWAGGGVLRAGASDEVTALAETLVAPVLSTYMGKGAIPEDHPLAGGSACAQGAYRAMLEDADVVLAVGTELGSETTANYELRLPTRLIHLDAAPQRIGTTYPALPLVGDARAGLAGLLDRARACRGRDGAKPRLDALRDRIADGLEASGQRDGRALVDAIRRVLPRDAIHVWDSTILAYWAAEFFPTFAPRSYLYPLGSGTIGYAWSAGLGVAASRPGAPVLAVIGDGGFAYGVADLASARQQGIDITLLLVDDGGYGILRHYQEESFGVTTAVDLAQPDFVALGEAYGVSTRRSRIDDLEDHLAQALAEAGPSLVVLEATIPPQIPTP